MAATKLQLTTGIVYLRDGALTISGPLTLSTGPLTLTSGQFLADVNADVTVPGYAFDGDTNTGIGSTAADTLHGVAGGTAVWTATGANSGQFQTGSSMNADGVLTNTQFGAFRVGVATGMRGGIIGAEFTGSAAISVIQGLNAIVSTTVGSSGNITGIARGGRYSIFHLGAGTIASAASVVSGFTIGASAGIVSVGDSFNAESPIVGAGSTLLDFSAFHARGGSIAGTLTTRYGVCIDDLIGGTTRYAIRTLGATDLVDFAGPVNSLSYAVGGVAGASFGPGMPTSITVVNGIITAIS